jgi:hypothetical protein
MIVEAKIWRLIWSLPEKRGDLQGASSETDHSVWTGFCYKSRKSEKDRRENVNKSVH